MSEATNAGGEAQEELQQEGRRPALRFPFVDHRINDDEIPEAPDMGQNTGIEVHQEKTEGFFVESSDHDKNTDSSAD